MLLENLIVVNGALELGRGALNAEQRQVARTIARAINALGLVDPFFFTALETRKFASQVEYYINKDVDFGEFDPIRGVRLVLESLEKKQADLKANYSGNLILIAAAADLLEFARILTIELDEGASARLNAYIPGECLPGQAMHWKIGGEGGVDYIVGDFEHKLKKT